MSLGSQILYLEALLKINNEPYKCRKRHCRGPHTSRACCNLQLYNTDCAIHHFQEL